MRAIGAFIGMKLPLATTTIAVIRVRLRAERRHRSAVEIRVHKADIQRHITAFNFIPMPHLNPIVNALTVYDGTHDPVVIGDVGGLLVHLDRGVQIGQAFVSHLAVFARAYLQHVNVTRPKESLLGRVTSRNLDRRLDSDDFVGWPHRFDLTRGHRITCTPGVQDFP